MNLGIVADEIDRNFAPALHIGTALGLRRYEIRNLTTGRAPLCDIAELQEVERVLACHRLCLQKHQGQIF